MSRSGYYDDAYDDPVACLYRGAVASATRGKRGQRLLRDVLEALDAMPVKELIAHELVNAAGQVCVLGALGIKRGLPDLDKINAEDAQRVAEMFDCAEPLAREIVWMNDDWDKETPAERWVRMRAWIRSQIRERTGIKAISREEES